jgi:hypothetical protein
MTMTVTRERASAKSISLEEFLARLLIATCPRSTADLAERVASMRFPKPLTPDVAAYAAERIAAAIRDEPRGLSVPQSLLPCFIEISDELYEGCQSGLVDRWLRTSTERHGFSTGFVANLVGVLNECLDPYRA